MVNKIAKEKEITRFNEYCKEIVKGDYAVSGALPKESKFIRRIKEARKIAVKYNLEKQLNTAIEKGRLEENLQYMLSGFVDRRTGIGKEIADETKGLAKKYGREKEFNEALSYKRRG